MSLISAVMSVVDKAVVFTMTQRRFTPEVAIVSQAW
jgi:hypothetical protein